MAEIELPNPHETQERADKPFTKMVALLVAIYAVGLAIASFAGKNVSKELMLLKQEQSRIESEARQKEQNEWNQYQSKSTRESLYRNERTILEAERNGTGASFPAYKASLLSSFIVEEDRMKKDKDELKASAEKIRKEGEAKVEKIEKEFHRNERKDPYFDFAEVLYQLAIVLASVAMLSEKRWAFIASLVLFVLALALTINGFGLFMTVPFIEGGGGH